MFRKSLLFRISVVLKEVQCQEFSIVLKEVSATKRHGTYGTQTSFIELNKSENTFPRKQEENT